MRAAGGAADITVRDDNDAVLQLSATLIRREDGTYFLVRIAPLTGNASSTVSQKVLSIVAKSSDAFVVTDATGDDSRHQQGVSST